MRTTVTTKNMVTIPAKISRAFAISPGCQLDWQEVPSAEGEIRVRVIPKRADLARQLLGSANKWAPERSATDDLVEERAREDRDSIQP